MKPPILFDRQLQKLRHARVQEDALFLHDHAVDMIHERIEEVNKSFNSVAIVGPQTRYWAGHFPKATTIIEDAEVLALKPQSHDLIIHGFGLHWANDPVGQLVQMRRALQPDGLMIAAFLGGQSLHELRTVLAETETALSGGLSPRVAPMGDIRDLGGLLQRAGLALPVADNFKVTVRYKSLAHLVADLRSMGETNILAQRNLRPLSREFLEAANALYHQHFSDEDGLLLATFELIFLTGWAPSDSQQKPLRPGSAQARLAEALNTEEQNPEK